MTHKEELGYAIAETPDGPVIVVASATGLVYLGWGGTARDTLLAEAERRYPDAILRAGANDAEGLATQVEALAAEPLPSSAAAIPLDLRGTDFQRSVWDVMRSIPPGSTMSYGEIAAAVGKPRAARAVGSACGANPVPIVVPCHRVITADGGIGGFSGELWRKEAMLRREGVSISAHLPG